MDEGYIKYHFNWIKESIIQAEQILDINKWRNRLMDQGYLGMYDNGIGYGNISIRLQDGNFMISGSATGGITTLTTEHYAVVTDFNLAKNELSCKGMTIASSESLTHAAIYACSKAINAIVHVHHKETWNKLLHHAATTDPAIAYGTPAMAYAIQDLISQQNLAGQQIIVMGGHEDGLIAYGKSIEEAAMAFLGN